MTNDIKKLEAALFMPYETIKEGVNIAAYAQQGVKSSANTLKEKASAIIE